jgi:hypothetical protein
MDRVDPERLDAEARSKLAIREALSSAAFRRALELSPEGARLAQVAAEAGVSPRAYGAQPDPRESVIRALATEKGSRIAQAVSSRPAAEPLDEAIIAVMVDEYAGEAEPDRVGAGLVAASALARGQLLEAAEVLERLLAGAIAARTGADPERSQFPRVIAAAVAHAARAASETWLRLDGSVPFASVLRDALLTLAPSMRLPASSAYLES